MPPDEVEERVTLQTWERWKLWKTAQGSRQLWNAWKQGGADAIPQNQNDLWAWAALKDKY